MGTTLSSAAALWGPPAQVNRVPWRYTDHVAYWRGARGETGLPVELRLLKGRVVGVRVSLQGRGANARLHSRYADRFGTRAPIVHRHFPSTRRFNACCAQDFWFGEPTRPRGYVFALNLTDDLGLIAVFIGSRAAFRCEYQECGD